MGEFSINKYGQTKTFNVGQKVEAIYYHEYPGEKKARKRSVISRLFDSSFKPVKFGKIKGSAGVHPYWLAQDNKEEYLWVKFPDYWFAKAIPISCLKDCEEAVKSIELIVSEYDKNLNKKIEEFSTYDYFKQQLEVAKNYLKP